MPILNIHTNLPIGDKEPLLKKASALVAEALAKPEGYVMIRISDHESMSFAGTTEPLAYVELKSIGLEIEQTTSLSETLCSFISENLGIEPARIYIEFAAPERGMFGWNSGTF
ncbi:MAG TPA: phenylpyruvate tautomerase MIF-related protein [Mariprofundaceae bacterium]|nr:phenylpyruvate tautomerase MIF-related protein [Mariprofundaceae bacterium]